MLCQNEENKSRSRHNVEGSFLCVHVEGSFLCVLYFGWPNQPSSGTMIIFTLVRDFYVACCVITGNK